MRAIVLTVAMAAAMASVSPAQEFVWWEAETPAATNFPARTWLSASRQEAGLLSGGQWLTFAGETTDGKPGHAAYDVKAPAMAAYHLWARKCWKHGPFRWRLDSQAWQTCGRDVALADSVTIRPNIPANWVYLGLVELAAGAHRFELELTGQDKKGIAAFDCFLLTPTVFFPAGTLKPGQRLGLADEGRFAYEPAPDAFGPEALLDLRNLNEAVAGQSGPMRRQGDTLCLGNGQPVRVWAVNLSAENAARDRQSIDYLARKLAKLGVNMVRFHSALWDAADPSRLDAAKLDNLHYLVSAMKKQGIYSSISFYFPLWLSGKSAALEGFDASPEAHPFGLLFFDGRMQTLWKGWAKGILSSPNRYTGLTLAGDPAVAMVEIVNEDSLFFWTFSPKNIPPLHWKRLEGRFAQWAIDRYGSLDKAYAQWQDQPRKGDAADALALTDAWGMTAKGLDARSGGARARVADQVRFLAGVQKQWYDEAAAYLKKDLDYRGLVVASNWKTADGQLLDSVERWTYTAGDVMDRHGYFGGPHSGQGAAWSVREGHTYADASGLTSPGDLPITAVQTAGFPQIISEINWPNPNRFRAEMTFLASAYGSLQGIDAMFFFAMGSNYARDTSMEKFALGSPVAAGTFPAAALAYRQGYIKQAPPSLAVAQPVEDVLSLKAPPLADAEALDELRKADRGSKYALIPADRLDALAFYVGPVLRRFTGEGEKLDLAKFIDKTGQTVRSATGELNWDFKRGLVTLNAPAAKGVCGFTGRAGPADLGGVRIACRNEYASVWVVSMDGQPLDTSRKVLVQAMTDDLPYGFKAAGGKITAMGNYPFGVRKIDAGLGFTKRSGSPRRVVTLDENGLPVGEIKAVTKGSTVGIPLSPDHIYTVIEW